MRGILTAGMSICLLVSNAYADRCYLEKGPMYTLGASPQVAFYDKFLKEAVPTQMLDLEKEVVTESTPHEFENYTVCEIDGGERVVRWIPINVSYHVFMSTSKLHAKPGMYAAEMLQNELHKKESELKQSKNFMPSEMQKKLQARIRQLLRIPGITRR